MIVVLLPLHFGLFGEREGITEKLPAREDIYQPLVLDGISAMCTSSSSESSSHDADNKRVALILRGQAFRDGGNQGAQSSCCAEAYINQRSVFYSHQVVSSNN